jgi:CRP-like cAMP-binding protein
MMLDDTATARLFRRLGNYVELGDAERQALQESAGSLRMLRSHEDLICEGDPVEWMAVLHSGFACRYKTTPDGRRQIVGYFLPGDLCTGRCLILRRIAHTVSTLAPCSIALVPHETLLALTERHPRLARAFGWAMQVEESIAHEWLLNVGQRTALERIAHLLCELLFRLRAVDLAARDTYELPLTQAELADTVALSTVHVNRTLKELRRQQLITMSGKLLTIDDVATLQSIAMFDPSYLHLDGEHPSSASHLTGRRGPCSLPRAARRHGW